MTKNIRNIGILAHIDSGKTTLTERILFYTGKIYKIKEIKDKDGSGPEMDFLDQERERGITIQSAATYCEWGNYSINIIDTPGHVDFTCEVERALHVLDGAILVLCGVAGVQAQSITVDRQMKRYEVPCIAFINKCDRVGADPIKVCSDLKNKLGHNSVMVQYPIGLEEKHRGLIDLIELKAYYFNGSSGEEIEEAEIPMDLAKTAQNYRRKLIEEVANINDEVAELYIMEEEIPKELLYKAIKEATIKRTLTPVFLGSAYKNKGVQKLLDGVVNYLPSPEDRIHTSHDQDNEEQEVKLSGSPEDPAVLISFKLEEGKYGQLTYCRLYQGTIEKGSVIYNRNNNKKHKIGRLVRMHANRMDDIETAQTGDIVALFGIECASGDTFTAKEVNYTMSSMFVPEAVVTLAIEPAKNEHLEKLSKALGRFGREDPTFRISIDPDSGQTIIGGMGELQLEVYVERIRREYNVDIKVGEPQVAYRETITKRTDFNYLHKQQTGGKGQYGHVVGYIEPIEDRYEFVNKVFGGSIPKEFISACDKGFQEALDGGGVYGYPVVGVRVVLTDGSSHSVDSSDFAFKIAASKAFKEAFQEGSPVILEPVMSVHIEAPDEFLGAVLGGINKRRGMILNQTVDYNFAIIESKVPLKEMFGYAGELRSSTQGKGTFTMEFDKYLPAPKTEEL